MHRSGDVMYISALGQGMLMINSQRAGVELLEKRANIYSDRPRFISAGDYATNNMSFSLLSYGGRYAVNHWFCLTVNPY